MSLFDSEEYLEVPLFRTAGRRRSEGDARFRGEYPPEWETCTTCRGRGREIPPHTHIITGHDWSSQEPIYTDLSKFPECPDCKGMGSVKGRVRLEAGHRCLRCKHPYVPKADAAKLGIVPPSGSRLIEGVTDETRPFTWNEGWSPCDEKCEHGGPLRWRDGEEWREVIDTPSTAGEWVRGSDTDQPAQVEAAWRVLTVHHADGDKSNLAWWNLLALCQRCHLEIQAKVVMERVYVLEHSDWFKPFVAAYYAKVYLGEDLSRPETEARLDELLDLERAPA